MIVIRRRCSCARSSGIHAFTVRNQHSCQDDNDCMHDYFYARWSGTKLLLLRRGKDSASTTFALSQRVWEVAITGRFFLGTIGGGIRGGIFFFVITTLSENDGGEGACTGASLRAFRTFRSCRSFERLKGAGG